MSFRPRKFFVWLVSLLAVLAVYLLYGRLSETPKIDIGQRAVKPQTDTVAEGETSEPDSEIGAIGKVGVGTVREAKYTHLNKEKQVDREFGFEKLLHKEASEWEVEKPYMNIFQPGFQCNIAADTGTVHVETAAGRAIPEDAVFTGNVVAHILPESPDNIKESFLYLDDIDFLSERSQLSTAGPFRFVSEDAEMLGRGLKLVYNDELNRLEFLRIIHLESLHLKNSQAALFASGQQRRSGTKGQKDKGYKQPTTSKEQRATNHYRCVLSKNVVIDTAEQLVSADEVCISNILWSKDPDRKYENKGTGSADEMKAAMWISRDIAAMPVGEPDELSEQLVDIVVTCDNGIVVAPMDVNRDSNPEPRMPNAESPTTNHEPRTTLVAQRIDYCAATGDTVASGPSELRFYVNDMMGAESNQAAVPVKITAQKKTKFSPTLNQVIFEGNTLCTMVREDPNVQRAHMLSAPKLTVDLHRGSDNLSSALSTDVEHITADGGVVRLATVTTAGEKLLGGVELKCRKFDYDAGQQMFLAAGPGLIKVDNSDISQRESDLDRFSLRRRCIAVVRNFDTLTYSLKANRIIADNKRERILIDYFPIVEGGYGQQAEATAGHVEVNLTETADGRIELSTLSATGGIDYEEEDVQFEGSSLFFDANKSMITVQGDELQPCLLNGVPVDRIEYDLETGRIIHAEIVGPGVLQIK